MENKAVLLVVSDKIIPKKLLIIAEHTYHLICVEGIADNFIVHLVYSFNKLRMAEQHLEPFNSEFVR